MHIIVLYETHYNIVFHFYTNKFCYIIMKIIMHNILVSYSCIIFHFYTNQFYYIIMIIIMHNILTSYSCVFKLKNVVFNNYLIKMIKFINNYMCIGRDLYYILYNF